MKYEKIKLTGKHGRGKYAIVDEEDFERLSKWKWHVVSVGTISRTTTLNGKNVRVSMGREIMQPKNGLIVDHINRDVLDNRKENLRICTRTQNNMNRGCQKNNKSGYKGVYFDKLSGKWRVAIKAYGKTLYLKPEECKEEAALAYNEAAKKLHGEFAVLNHISHRF